VWAKNPAQQEENWGRIARRIIITPYSKVNYMPSMPGGMHSEPLAACDKKGLMLGTLPAV
jgi:hypothetical protein